MIKDKSRRAVRAVASTELSIDPTTEPDGNEACHKTLNTAELLEILLLGVDDMRTVLLAQRVNKMFQGTIKGSTHLQRKLWLFSEPEEESRHCFRYGEFSDCIFSNPLFNKVRVKQGRFLELRPRVITWPLACAATFQRAAFFGTSYQGQQKSKSVGNRNDSWLKEGTQSWRSMLLAKFGPDADVSEFDLSVYVTLYYEQRVTRVKVDKDTTVQDLVESLRTKAQEWVDEDEPDDELWAMEHAADFERVDGRLVKKKIAF